MGFAKELTRKVLHAASLAIFSACASKEVRVVMKVTPEKDSKKMVLPFPSVDAAETIATFRRNLPSVFPLQAPKSEK
eukprot:2397170-Pyramimonas_sp.AAC.1